MTEEGALHSIVITLLPSQHRHFLSAYLLAWSIHPSHLIGYGPVRSALTTPTAPASSRRLLPPSVHSLSSSLSVSTLPRLALARPHPDISSLRPSAMFNGELTLSPSPPSLLVILTTSNYHVWAPKTRHRLMALGLVGYIQGEEQRPVIPTVTSTGGTTGVSVKSEGAVTLATPDLSASAYERAKELAALQKQRRTWDREDGKAIATILSLMREDLQSIATEEMTSKALWDAIKAKWGQQSGHRLREHLSFPGVQEVRGGRQHDCSHSIPPQRQPPTHQLPTPHERPSDDALPTGVTAPFVGIHEDVSPHCHRYQHRP